MNILLMRHFMYFKVHFGTIVIVVGSVDIRNWGQFPQSHKRNCITNTRDDIVHEFRNNLATILTYKNKATWMFWEGIDCPADIEHRLAGPSNAVSYCHFLWNVFWCEIVIQMYCKFDKTDNKFVEVCSTTILNMP